MAIVIPENLRPADGRFGSGPSKIRPEQVEAVAAAAFTPLGTSHRQAPVKQLVSRIRGGLRELFALPDGYEVVLGNGGATAFWEVACASLVAQRAQAAVFGEFGGKFAAAVAKAPFLDEPTVVSAPPGSVAFLDGALRAADGAEFDVFATVQNETSTGAAVPISRVSPAGSLMLVDATSAAGGLPIDISQTDVYYFSPQKAFASDGGLWIAIASPAAIERAATIEGGNQKNRWVPEFLSLTTALENSVQDQTLNTPAVATLIMFAEQVEWMLANGGLDWAVGRSAASAKILYDWADSSPYAAPFVSDPAHRSAVVGTIDLADEIDASRVVKELRHNGIFDVFPYRKLGRNQLRVAMFPAIDPTDVAALTESIAYTIENL
ncbi:MAG: phosphoserine transaminase [Cellulomonadaceae bacterium]|jgi:phosphoserine aminotransferase|nr:phosphoserine transaminase [Cellulomonadaceae bacterium]